MKFERSTDDVAPRDAFLRRMFVHFAIATAVIGGSLLVGVLG